MLGMPVSDTYRTNVQCIKTGCKGKLVTAQFDHGFEKKRGLIKLSSLLVVIISLTLMCPDIDHDIISPGP
jgi:hypothetical protein